MIPAERMNYLLKQAGIGPIGAVPSEHSDKIPLTRAELERFADVVASNERAMCVCRKNLL